MRALLFILFFPFSFFGHDDGKELLDMALDKCERLESLEDYRDILSRYRNDRQAPAGLPPEREVPYQQHVWRQDSSRNEKTQFPFGY